jgi:hypothetical protein
MSVTASVRYSERVHALAYLLPALEEGNTPAQNSGAYTVCDNEAQRVMAFHITMRGALFILDGRTPYEPASPVISNETGQDTATVSHGVMLEVHAVVGTGLWFFRWL